MEGTFFSDTHTVLSSMVRKDLIHTHFKFNLGGIPLGSPQIHDTMQHFSGSILNLGTSQSTCLGPLTLSERLCF